VSKLVRSIMISTLLTSAACQGVKFSTQASNSAQSVSPTNTPPTNNPIAAVSCTIGNNGSPQNTMSYPNACLANPGLPANSVGFEMNNLTNYHVTLNSNSASGTQNGVWLYVEIATYEEADTIVINAVSTTGQSTQLLDICNYSTDSEADPTNPHGQVRPYSDSILPFNLWLPAGTASITFSVDENTPYNSGSPTYIGVWNLNAFQNAIQNIPASGLGTDSSYNFRPQSAPLSQYNDQLDKNNPSYPNYCAGSP
jgi:hypothetical protein